MVPMVLSEFVVFTVTVSGVPAVPRTPRVPLQLVSSALLEPS